MGQKKISSKYALPCMLGDLDHDFEMEDVFFITFSTTDEKEALALASCICGNAASKSLVVITENGHVFPL
jgi:hypothetical protein